MKKDVCQSYTIMTHWAVAESHCMTMKCTISDVMDWVTEMESDGIACRVIDDVEKTIIYETP